MSHLLFPIFGFGIFVSFWGVSGTCVFSVHSELDSEEETLWKLDGLLLIN